MNFDDLKEAWAGDQPEAPAISPDYVSPERSAGIVARLRRTMRRELLAQAVAAGLLIFIVYPGRGGLSTILVTIAVLILILQTVFFLFRFYRFYKAIGVYDLSVRKNIRKIVLELKLNIEIYRTFNYCAFPLVALIIAGGSSDLAGYLQKLAAGGGSLLSIAGLFLFLLGVQVILVLFTDWYIRIRYMFYLNALQRIMEDLDSDS